jgi:hypothetical protein
MTRPVTSRSRPVCRSLLSCCSTVPFGLGVQPETLGNHGGEPIPGLDPVPVRSYQPPSVRGGVHPPLAARAGLAAETGLEITVCHFPPGTGPAPPSGTRSSTGSSARSPGTGAAGRECQKVRFCLRAERDAESLDRAVCRFRCHRGCCRIACGLWGGGGSSGVLAGVRLARGVVAGVSGLSGLARGSSWGWGRARCCCRGHRASSARAWGVRWPLVMAIWRLWTAQANCHSPAAFRIPRMERRRMPMLCLMRPWGVSAMGPRCR